jgi:hypothetical protein
MRLYVAWQKDQKNVAIMDITKIVDDTQALQPELERAIIANAVLDLTKADFIITADSEEQMMEMFPNADVKYEKNHNKEIH